MAELARVRRVRHPPVVLSMPFSRLSASNQRKAQVGSIDPRIELNLFSTHVACVGGIPGRDGRPAVRFYLQVLNGSFALGHLSVKASKYR